MNVQPGCATGDSRSSFPYRVLRHKPHAAAGVNEKGAATYDHRACLQCCIRFTVGSDDQRQCGERDRGLGAKKTGETFGLEDISDYCEQRDHQPAKHKSEYKLHRCFTPSRGATGDIRKVSSSEHVHTGETRA
jgi:hypothetical protein